MKIVHGQDDTVADKERKPGIITSFIVPNFFSGFVITVSMYYIFICLIPDEIRLLYVIICAGIGIIGTLIWAIKSDFGGLVTTLKDFIFSKDHFLRKFFIGIALFFVLILAGLNIMILGAAIGTVASVTAPFLIGYWLAEIIRRLLLRI